MLLFLFLLLLNSGFDRYQNSDEFLLLDVSSKTLLQGQLVTDLFSHSDEFVIRRRVGGAPFRFRPLLDRFGILISFVEDDDCITLDLICNLVSDDLVPASRAVPMRNLVSKRPFALGGLVVSPSKFQAVLSRKRGPGMHHTCVIGNLVCGVSLPHEDGWVAHEATISSQEWMTLKLFYYLDT